MAIPLFNLRRQHNHLTEEIVERFRLSLEECDFVFGQSTSDYEKAFAQFVNCRHAIGVNSASDALLMSLRALDIMPGDDVIVPAYGPIAAAEAVARLFANPVFVDIEPKSYGIDPMKLQETVTDRTRAIIASHVYGSACVIDQITQFAQATGLTVVEDASQALGGVCMNKKLGTFGAAGCYSFHPTMNLGAAGSGGMIATDDDDLASRLRGLRNNGTGEEEMVYDEVGLFSPLDGVQACFLRLKLDELSESNADRVENARLYEQLLQGTPLKRPRFADDGTHVYCFYTVEHDDRDELQAFLTEKGIGAKPYYPLPQHLQPSFEYLEYAPGDFPVAEAVSKRVLSIPVYPGLTKHEIEEVGAAICEFFAAAE